MSIERQRRRYLYRDSQEFLELLRETPMLVTPHLAKAMELAFNAARMTVEDEPRREDNDSGNDRKPLPGRAG